MNGATNPQITVILCTYNRGEKLAEALESIFQSHVIGDRTWEFLVVDNNSTDRTRDVVREFSERYPGTIRYVFEPKQGLSHARNAGIGNARGTILAFVDDDVTVEPQWLQNLTSGLHDGTWAGAGGRVLPKWAGAAPPWLDIKENSTLTGTLALFDQGAEAKQLSEPPFGANMAYHITMFEKYGLFRTDLGRRPGSLLSNEDTEFGRRVLSGGELLRYEPSAIVNHPVAEERLRKEYFLNWWFDKGRSDIREFGARNGTGKLWRGIPGYLLTDLIRSTLRWIVTFRRASRFYRKVAVWETAGRIAECRHNAGGGMRERKQPHQSLTPSVRNPIARSRNS
jgi:glycosyltransferase involved in cell wall biosynthesis